MMKVAFLVTSAVLFLPFAHAWGGEGHEIVATIAQAYLQPKTLTSVCKILGESPCHLAPISTWADKVRNHMRWSAPMHFINPIGDNPSKDCPFPGPEGWDGKENANVLDGIKNVTNLLKLWVRQETSDAAAEEALKFLVHWVGDLHQPLHLSGRAKGGNGIKVRFAGKETNLHSVWDTSLINKFVKQTPDNYSEPLDNKAIEGALRNEPYDPYIRRIMWEGVLGQWQKEVNSWFKCGKTAMEFGSPESQQRVLKVGVEINPDGPIVCPYYWATSIHLLNCDIAWPSEFDDNDHGDPDFQLDTEEYSGVIGQRMVIEKLLAQGGIRLAGILNYVFARK